MPWAKIVLSKKGLTPKGILVIFTLFLLLTLGYKTTSGFWAFNPKSGHFPITINVNSQKIALLEANLPIDPELARGGGDITIEDSALVPEVGPLGSGAEVMQVIPQNGEISTYVVKDGDSLSQIAETFGVSVNTIVWANNLPKGAIKKGDVLVILPVSGVKHIVKKGDTLAKIATNYKSDVVEIAQFNGLASDADLTSGTEIIIPNGELQLETPKPAKPKPGTKPGQIDSEGRSPSTASKYASLPTYSGYYIRPISGGTKTQGIHGYNGVDLADRSGVPVVASAGGQVIVARTGGWNGGYGNYVVISHSNGTQTLYGHLLDVSVTTGQSVGQGEVIGHLGSSGRSTGPHVHFEIRGARNPF